MHYDRQGMRNTMTTRHQLALVLLLAMALLGATVARPVTPAHVPALPRPRGVAAVVDGQPVPLALYHRELGIYRVTLPEPPASSAGRRVREAAAADHALRRAVASTIIAVTAARRGLVATPAAVRAELARMRAEA